MRHRTPSREAQAQHLYVAIPESAVPKGIRWYRIPGRPNKLRYPEHTTGKIYKRIRDLRVPTVYFRLIDIKPMSPKEQIDAEPTPSKRRCVKTVGSHHWFVDIRSRWYLCRVVARTSTRVTIRCVTGKDDLREVDWPYGEDLELSWSLLGHLRPLHMRKT